MNREKDYQTVWRCRVCKHEYSGERLPSDYSCPVCKHPAADFEKIIRICGCANSILEATKEDIFGIKFYSCEICGNFVEMIKNSGVPITCCGQKMKEVIPGTSGGIANRHAPIYRIVGTKIYVTVGETQHPMLDDHYIEWIVIDTTKGVYRIKLTPNSEAKATRTLEDDEIVMGVYAYCSRHGLWKGE